MNAINVYHRADDVEGVGYLIEHCARPMHSIAWPDRVSERMSPDELERLGVTFETIVSALQTVKVVADVRYDASSDSVGVETANVEATVVESSAEVVEETASVPPSEADEDPEGQPSAEAETDGDTEAAGVVKSEAATIREYLTTNPDASNVDIIEAIAADGMVVTSSQVSYQRKKLKG